MRYLILFFFFFYSSFSIAQSDQYARASIKLFDKSIDELSSLGIEVDHGHHIPYRYLTSDFSLEEIDRVRSAGFEVEILISDVVAHYQDPNRIVEGDEKSKLVGCDLSDLGELYPYKTPDNYRDGSIAGYFTYQEMLDILDEMREKYPNLISAKETIGDYTTVNGNQILWLRVSDNPDVDEEDEEEVLYTALHHAREPNSLSQMIFYLWYLLENYETDPYVKFLVDNSEMYFIPCVNPDGYIFNEISNPNGGGGWRKNRWADDYGEVWGVDLNRNYGYFWGFDDVGSSSNYASSTFRGLEAFSEIETQAVRDFCLDHSFRLTLNYHTFGNLLIHPWGYSDTPTDEDVVFKSFGNAMNEENAFTLGTGSQTVGYIVNGVSDDWMYGAEELSVKSYSFTPEVGANTDGFWPDESRIDLLNRSVLAQNLTMAHLVIDRLEVIETNPVDVITEREGNIFANAKMIGLSGGSGMISLVSDNSSVVIDTDPIDYNYTFWEAEDFVFNFSLGDDILDGDLLDFYVVSDNGSFKDSLQITKTFLENTGNLTPVFADEVTDLNNWNSDGWELSMSEFVSAPFSITDSEEGNYPPAANKNIELVEKIDLSDARFASLNFYAKWDIENDFDFVQILASTDQINYVPLCGKFTNEGTTNQRIGEPLYDGVMEDWVLEEMSLADFLGEEITVRLEFRSDNFVEGDGFYFDDVSVNILSEITSSSEDLEYNRAITIVPNPAGIQTEINIPSELVGQNTKLIIINNIGQLVHSQSVLSPKVNLDTDIYDNGVYWLRITAENGLVINKKLIIQK